MVVFEKILQDLDMTRYLFSITFDASPLIYMIGDEFIAAAWFSIECLFLPASARV